MANKPVVADNKPAKVNLSTDQKDLATFDYEMARLSGIVYAGMAGQP